MALTTTDGFVKRANLDGTGLTTLASGLGFLSGIDVTADNVYVSALSAPFTTPQGNPATGAGRILSMGLEGTSVQEVIRVSRTSTPICRSVRRRCVVWPCWLSRSRLRMRCC